MKDFIKSVLASALGIILVLFAGGFMFLVLILALVGSSTSSHPTSHVSVKAGTMLVIGSGLTITDTPEFGASSVDELVFGKSGPRLDLLRALEAIDLAARDKNIAGIVLSGPLSAGIAQKAELRNALKEFKKCKKPIIAWLENAGQGEYYLSSIADQIYTHINGEVELKGLASYNLYFGETLKMLGIGVQVVKVGKYKSAVEPYIGNKMSAEAREQSQVLMAGLWRRLLSDIAKSRGVNTESLSRLIEKGGFFSGPQAVKNKLADSALHRDELIDKVIEAGAKFDVENNSFRKIGLLRYSRKVSLPSRGEQIAIVYAEGEIVDGWGNPNNVGGDRFAHILRTLRHDDDIKAVVLRINSPGGSAFASDVIAREIKLFEKPFVVSMGDVAASGGYYIAAQANVVFADPSTITGSIGVFGLHLNYGDLASKIQLGTDGVKTGRYADLMAEHRPASPAELAIVQTSVDDVYETFLRIVSEGRKLKRDSVHEIAQGRVWLGEDARGLRLIDEFGGLRDAIRKATDLAKLDSAEWLQIPALHAGRQSFIEQLLDDDDYDSPIFSKQSKNPSMEFLRKNTHLLNSLQNLNDPRKVYLTCPISPPRL